MAAHQVPPSLGFSKQEHWSGLPFPSLMHESEVAQSCQTLSDPMDCSHCLLLYYRNNYIYIYISHKELDTTEQTSSLSIYIYIHTHIYIYIYTHTHTHIHTTWEQAKALSRSSATSPLGDCWRDVCY